jgi:uncharacterized protein YcfJ
MNKSMLIGVVAGIGVAAAGGVTAFALLGQPSELDANGSAAVVEAPAVPEEQITPAPAAAATATPAPKPVAAAPRPVAQPAPQPAPEPVVQEECWDEEVVVQVEPKDDKAIAGTAAGAVIGGALAKKLGDDNDLAAAAGAAAGGFFGRRAQRNRQENNTETVIERRCAPVGSR